MINRITNEEIPSILYKYRDWKNKFHRRLITNQEIYFPKPSAFNDPFDGNIPVRWDLMSYEECFDKNLELINTDHKDKDQKLVREYAKKVTDEKTLWHPGKLRKERSEQLNKWNSIIGLFSLSKMNDNILMWSHYSLNHSGFVVGLNTDSLVNDYDFDYLEPIKYQEEYPIIKGTDDTTFQFYKKFFHKSELWEYEKEWRLSKNHIENRLVKLKKDSIDEIIIGCSADNKQINDIIEKTRKYLLPSTKIYKAEKSEENFELNIDEIK
ncbi:MAG: DUF2971 domain-containing protein [bacterium]